MSKSFSRRRFMRDSAQRAALDTDFAFMTPGGIRAELSFAADSTPSSSSSPGSPSPFAPPLLDRITRVN